MPSGAKKRKAAKKKKEKGGASTTNNPSSTTTTSRSVSHGDEDRKNHESDGGEFSDQHNSEQNSTDGEEVEVGKKKVEGSNVEGNKSVDDVKVEHRAAEVVGVTQIERETKQDDEFDKKGSSSRSSSSSSSDDESRAVEKDITVTDNAPAIDSIEAVDSYSEGQSQVIRTTLASKLENHVEKFSVLVEKAEAESAATAVSSLSSDAGQKENGEINSSSSGANDRLGGVMNDLVPENKKEKMAYVAASSDLKESAAHENEEKLLLSYNAPRDDAAKDAEHVKDSEDLGSSDRQPLVASVVRPVQTTSWKGCCGLFELFTGSNA